ncbi:hypothetical protein EON65_07065 [archaeon]|nr:MAG: hypothetical protein EON65_07065 [archaeon]
MLEDSADEFEIGNVDCTLPSPNNKYCESWFTEKKEYKKCWLELVQNSDNSGYTYVTACCGDDGYKNEPCCKTICPVSYYNAYQPQVEDIRCNCTTESENKEYCADWYCELVTLYDPYGNDKPVQHEWYTCTSSEDGKYCSAWTGKIESIEEFELAACSCQVAGTDSSYCDKWTCYEKGTDYWWPNLLWILFPILLGSLTFMMPLIGGWGVFVHAGFWLCHVVWSGSLIVIGIWKAGLVVMFISILPLYVIPSLWILVYNVRVYNWNTILDSSLNNRTGMTASRRVTTNRGGVLGRRDVPDGLQAAVTVGDVELAAGILVEVTLEDLKGYVDVVAYERLHSTILDSDDID